MGILTGKNRKLSEVLNKINVNICSVQDKKWKRVIVREIEDWYKILYSEKTSTSNNVGVILDVKIKGNVIHIIKKICMYVLLSSTSKSHKLYTTK